MGIRSRDNNVICLSDEHPETGRYFGFKDLLDDLLAAFEDEDGLGGIAPTVFWVELFLPGFLLK
jgi:hypothetical protein